MKEIKRKLIGDAEVGDMVGVVSCKVSGMLMDVTTVSRVTPAFLVLKDGKRLLRARTKSKSAGRAVNCSTLDFRVWVIATDQELAAWTAHTADLEARRRQEAAQAEFERNDPCHQMAHLLLCNEHWTDSGKLAALGQEKLAAILKAMAHPDYVK